MVSFIVCEKRGKESYKKRESLLDDSQLTGFINFQEHIERNLRLGAVEV